MMAVWMVAQISMDALAAARGAAIRRGEEGYRSGTPVRYLRSLFFSSIL
jgi:hypothetical protein